MPPKKKRDRSLPSSASPTRYLLKIDSFSLLSTCDINKFESQFESCGYKWKMTIYPNGYGDARDHISMYLGIIGTSSLPTDWEVNSTVSFLIFDQIHDNYVVVRGTQRRFHNIKTEWGLPKFISHTKFKDPSNGYLVNDKCLFGVDLYVIKNQLVGECMSSLNIIQPYKHVWKISEFSKLKNVVCSEEFNVGDYKWKLKLYPIGYSQVQNVESISIYFILVDAKGFDSQKRVQASFNISVKDQITGARHTQNGVPSWFSAATPLGRGWISFMALSELKDPNKGFLVDDCCIVETEVSVLGVVNGCIPNHY